VTVALAIAGLVLASATSATVALQRSLSASRLVAQLATDAHFTLEQLLRPLRNAGGDAVRPWQAISNSCVDDARFALPACAADRGRLHVVRIESPTFLRIVAASSASVTLAARPDGSCPAPVGRDVVLFPSEGTSRTMQGPAWRARRCAAAFATGCGCTFASTNPGFDARVAAAVTDAQLAGGNLVEARVLSFYVDGSRLMLLTDLDGSGGAAATPFAPRVSRFATRLGYDADVDGVIEASTTTPQTTSLDRLRLVRVGLALGARAPDGRTARTLFLGGNVADAGQQLVVAEGNAVLRATGVFQ
jgi:hypothetical protein